MDCNCLHEVSKITRKMTTSIKQPKASFILVTGTAKVTSLERSWETHVDITGVITVEQKLVFEVSLFYCLVLTYSSFFLLWCNVVLLNATNVQLYKIVVVQNENILWIISLHRGSFIVLLSSFLRC